MSHLAESRSEEEGKKPDFIITDDGQEYIYGSQAHSGVFGQQDEDLLHLKKIKSPLALRFLCLLGIFLCLLFMAVTALWLAATAVLAALFLFQNQKANHATYRFWKLFQNSLVTLFSLVIAIISPTLGFGLLILYFTLRGEAKDRNFLRKNLKRFL